MPNLKKSNPVERAHSDFSASGSERWLFGCPGSVQKNRGKESEDSAASIEGTAAHELGAAALIARVCPTKLRLKGKVPDEFHHLISDDMRWEVKKYFDFVMPYYDKGDVFIETKFDLSWIYPTKLVHKDKVPKGEFAPKGKFTMFGTGDVVVVEPWGDVHVIDLKYGKGKIVNALENPQLAFYGIGGAVEAKWDFPRAHLTIFQPRRDHFPTWTLSHDELHSWVGKFQVGVHEAVQKDAPLKPGPWCKFCPSEHDCEAKLDGMNRELQTQFADTPAVVDPKKLSGEQLGKILDKGKHIEEWLKGVRAEAIRRLEGNQSVPGYKMVGRKGERVWKDMKRIEAHCRKLEIDEMFTEPELRSPAQAEKILGKKFVAKHAIHSAGGRTLARDSDTREKLISKVQSDFED
jgi:hypothetical protein